jgi:hypothetical protein
MLIQHLQVVEIHQVVVGEPRKRRLVMVLKAFTQTGTVSEDEEALPFACHIRQDQLRVFEPDLNALHLKDRTARDPVPRVQVFLSAEPPPPLVLRQVRRLKAHWVAEVFVEEIPRAREAFGAGRAEDHVRFDRAAQRERDAARQV